MPSIPVALQMYTVRDVAESDFLGTVRKVAEIGYSGIELAGVPVPAQDLKDAMDDLGLEAASIHFGYQALTEDASACIETAVAVGCRYVTCSGLFTKLRETAEGFEQAGVELSRAGRKCAEHGIELCYHNHSFEFARFGGKYAYDILFESSDRHFLKAQIDTYWVRHGGEDPAAYIRKYAGRCPLVHLKDMADDAERSFAEVGEGILDFEAIFKASEAAGVQWYIVEQDFCKGSSLDSARTSFENLKRMGRA